MMQYSIKLYGNLFNSCQDIYIDKYQPHGSITRKIRQSVEYIYLWTIYTESVHQRVIEIFQSELKWRTNITIPVTANLAVIYSGMLTYLQLVFTKNNRFIWCWIRWESMGATAVRHAWAQKRGFGLDDGFPPSPRGAAEWLFLMN